MFEHVDQKELFEYDDLLSITGNSKREYISPEGILYPSITTVLSILSDEAIHAWRQRVGEAEANKISSRAARRGTAVHTLCEKYLDNDPDYAAKAMPNVIADFKKIQKVLDERVSKIYCQEKALFSKYLGVAGRVDLIADFDGKRSVVDFKTSSRDKDHDSIHSYFIQETAYAIMFEERTGLPITQLVTIIASDDSPEAQVFIEHRDNWSDKLINTIRDYKILKG